MNDTENTCEIFSFDEEKVNYLKKEVEGIKGLGQVFKALSDENRVKILYALSREELCVCDVAQIINSSVGTASHHLRLLKNIGLAQNRKEGKMIFYSLKDECVKLIIEAALMHYKEQYD